MGSESLFKKIKLYVEEVTSMKYKTCITENIKLKTKQIKKKFGRGVKIKISSSSRRRGYSANEINTLVNLKKSGYSDKAIAIQLGRTYWSIVYKIKELRKEGLL